MKKIAVCLVTFLLCMNSYATSTTELTTTISKSLQSHLVNSKRHPSIFYGGQDLSHPKMAIANENFWGSHKLLG